MERLFRDLSIAFAAGALGALANSVVVWAFGQLGITTGLGVNVAPEWSAAWLYPRLVWGGLWGFLLVLPLLQSKWFLRGLLISLGPTIALLFYFFPMRPPGMLGLGLGALTPVFVLFFNAVWGVTAAWWYRVAR